MKVFDFKYQLKHNSSPKKFVFVSNVLMQVYELLQEHPSLGFLCTSHFCVKSCLWQSFGRTRQLLFDSQGSWDMDMKWWRWIYSGLFIRFFEKTQLNLFFYSLFTDSSCSGVMVCKGGVVLSFELLPLGLSFDWLSSFGVKTHLFFLLMNSVWLESQN